MGMDIGRRFLPLDEARLDWRSTLSFWVLFSVVLFLLLFLSIFIALSASVWRSGFHYRFLLMRFFFFSVFLSVLWFRYGI